MAIVASSKSKHSRFRQAKRLRAPKATNASVKGRFIVLEKSFHLLVDNGLVVLAVGNGLLTSFFHGLPDVASIVGSVHGGIGVILTRIRTIHGSIIKRPFCLDVGTLQRFYRLLVGVAEFDHSVPSINREKAV